MLSIQILTFLLLTYEVIASCTEPRHDQQYFCGAQNAFTAFVDDIKGPPGDLFDRTYTVTVRRRYRGSEVLPNTTITLYGRSTSCGPTILDLKKHYKIYASTNGPRLEIISHEEIPPAFEGRMKIYDCTCQECDPKMEILDTKESKDYDKHNISEEKEKELVFINSNSCVQEAKLCKL